MTLYTLSIRRPVLALVMSLTVVLFGAISFGYLGVREFPVIDPPIITVVANYRGANADVIETQITTPLEEAVNGIDGIRTLTSASREGRSTITVEFQLGADLERAANDVRDRVAGAQSRLPPDIDPPTVSKSDADSQPIVTLNIRSDSRDLLELSRIANDSIKEPLQTIPGVARVDIWGERTYAMRLWLDPQRLAAYRLSPLDVQSAVERENVELPAGRIEGHDVELPVRTMSRLDSPEEFEDLILKEQGGRVVRLRDVGRAELGPLNARTVFKNFGEPMVAAVLRPQPGANFVEIADEVYRRLAHIRSELPADVEVSIGFDTTQYIRESVTEVQQTILLAIFLVVLIIYLFLRDFRTTLIPVVAIPVALVGAFALMYAFGFSINVLTLLGLVLSIGLVVDDAIVVLENIFVKIEGGKDPMTAAVEGTREIFFAVVATTVALVAVFLPILFLGGLTGRLFREFGATLAGAVVISAFVALTLTPMMCSRLLRARHGHSWFYEKSEPFFRGLADGYRRSLSGFLGHRWLAWPAILLALGLSGLFFAVLPAELAPLEDRSNLRLQVKGPEGATFEYMDRFVDRLAADVQEEAPESRVLISVTSPGFGSSAVNTGFVRQVLVDRRERTRSQQEIADALTARANRLTGARVFVTQEPTISVGRRGGLPIQFVLQAPNMERLTEALPRFLDAANDSPVFSFVDVDLVFDKPELQIEIDRARARDLGISAIDIARTLQLSLSEQRVGFFVLDGRQYEVVAQVERRNRDATFDVANLYVPSRTSAPVLLDKLVTVREESSPPQLFHFDRYLAATVSANLAPGFAMQDGIEEMRAIAERTVDDTFSTTLAGLSRDFTESSSSLAFVFVLALVLIYLVLAAQFESFRDPLIIMMTVPISLVGALFALWYFGLTLNIFSEIGMIMLIGLVTKNGILIVEFANQRRAAGLALMDATVEAATARLRPVLMTSLSTVLGILPIALALGAGSESRVPMGVAIVGGMLVGTVLTLFVVPAVYSYLATKEVVGTLASEAVGEGLEEVPAAA